MNLMKEYRRKIFHIVLGTIMGLLILYVRKRFITAVLTGIISAGVLMRLFLLKGYRFKPIEFFIERYGRPKEIGSGAMNFLIGILISLIFPFPRLFSAAGAFILGISDGLATIAGINSKHKIYNKKSFEGTSAFFVSSFVIIYLITKSMFQTTLSSILLTLLELISPIDDNLMIPIATTLILSLLNVK